MLKTSYRSIALMIAFAAVIFDQISKWLITEMLIRPRMTGEAGLNFIDWLRGHPAHLPFTEIKLAPFFSIVMVWNKGVSFGLFNHGQMGDNGMGLIIVSLIVSFLFLIWMLRSKSGFQSFCLALVIGGAIGNVIDRARFGAVIDFLDFHMNGWHWPAFNVADSCIVVGVILLIIHSLFLETRAKKQVD